MSPGGRMSTMLAIAGIAAAAESSKGGYDGLGRSRGILTSTPEQRRKRKSKRKAAEKSRRRNRRK